MTNETQINEVFDLASAKGYDYEITDMSTVTIPEIKFQATFEADNGVEYAFRVYRADSMAGRRYGPHSRLLVFMRKKSRNFSQGITIDMGTFKKVLVTFMRCYRDYKEDSKDGKKSSSYAVVMPDTMRPYASLFVRANRRAFKNNRRIHLNLVGVNEEGKGNTIEMMFVNSQSMFPYFGGKDYDATKFETNDTFVKLAKLDGQDIELAPPTQPTTPVADGSTQVSPANVQAPTTQVRDKFNPDGIPGLNDPANFSQQFVMDAFMAKGRDALEAVFKKYKIHRRYFAANIAKAVDMWRTEYDVKRDYSHGNPDDIKDGVGFYIRRDLPQVFSEFMSVIVRANLSVTIDSLQRWVENDELKTIGLNSPIVPTVVDAFMRDYLLPVSAGVAEEYQKIKSTFEKLGIPFDRLRRSALINASSNTDQVMIASIVLNAIDPINISDVNIIHQYSEDKTGGKLVLQKDKYDLVVEALKIAKVTPQYKVELVAPITINGSDYQDVVASFVSGDYEKIRAILIGTYRLNVKSDESYEALKGIVAAIKNNSHHFDVTKVFSSYSEITRNAYTRGSDSTFFDNMKTIIIAYITSLTKVNLYQIPANTRYDQEFIRDSSIVSALVNVMFSTQSECLAEFRALVDEWENMHTDELSKNMVERAGEMGFIDSGFVNEINQQIRRNLSSYRSRYSSPEQSLPRQLYHYLKVGDYKDMYSVYSASTEANRHDLIARIVREGDPSEVSKLAESINDNGDAMNIGRLINQATYSVKNAATAAAILNRMYDQSSTLYNMYNKETSALALKATVARGAFSESLNAILEHIPEPELKVHIRNNPACLRFTNSDDQFADDIPAFAINAAIEGINMSQVNKVNTSWGETAPNQVLVDYIAAINSDMLNKMSDASIQKLKGIFSNIKATSTSKRTTYQPMLDRMADVLSEADLSNHSGLTQGLLDSVDERERRLLVKSIGKNFFFNRYIDELRNHSEIKMNINLNQKSIASILNFNNISLAKLPTISEKDTIESAKRKVQKVDLGVPEEKVVKLDLTRDQLDDLTVEYDAFNRKKHNLSLIIDDAFSVSIPKQVAGRAAWDAKMEAEGVNSKIMAPVFHGTGSIAAAMILRLGFAVSSIDDTKKTGVKTAGRMLGDGVYFSTAIDKVAQYASDGGFGRRLGAEGYIFEMNASLGKHRRDFREAGTGSQFDERNVISPEWAVFNPNDQLVINKAYKIRRVPHHVLDRLKRSRKNVNESKNVTAIRGFRDVIRENLDYGVNEKMITFIFSDGMIPVAGGQLVDFDNYANELGSTVRVEGGQLGAMVSFTQLAEFEEEEVDIYHIALTEAFVHDDPLKDMYFKLVQRAIKV